MNLTENQALAIGILAKGGKTKDAAKACNVNSSTINRWRKQEEFNQALEKASESLIKDIESNIDGYKKALLSATDNAYDCLQEVIKISKDEAVPTSLRLKACEMVLNQANKLVEMKNKKSNSGDCVLFHSEIQQQEKQKITYTDDEYLISMGFVPLSKGYWASLDSSHPISSYEALTYANHLKMIEIQRCQ